MCVTQIINCLIKNIKDNRLMTCISSSCQTATKQLGMMSTRCWVYFVGNSIQANFRAVKNLFFFFDC